MSGLYPIDCKSSLTSIFIILTVILVVFGILVSIVLFKELMVIKAVTTTITLAGITPLGILLNLIFGHQQIQIVNIPSHKECNP